MRAIEIMDAELFFFCFFMLSSHLFRSLKNLKLMFLLCWRAFILPFYEEKRFQQSKNERICPYVFPKPESFKYNP